MSGQDWSIMITPDSRTGGPANYTPDVMGAKAGDPLQTSNADIVSWNNRTPDQHQPVSNGKELCNVIQPWQSSTPGYVTTAPTSGTTTIDYTCTFHPNEHGSIIVWSQAAIDAASK